MLAEFPVREVSNGLILFLCGLLVARILVGGHRYLRSGGDSSGVAAAKNTIIYAIIGLVLLALMQVGLQSVLSSSAGFGRDESQSWSLLTTTAIVVAGGLSSPLMTGLILGFPRTGRLLMRCAARSAAALMPAGARTDCAEEFYAELLKCPPLRRIRYMTNLLFGSALMAARVRAGIRRVDRLMLWREKHQPEDSARAELDMPA